MSINISTVFDALAVRDISDHTSDKVYNGGAVVKSVAVENGCNQAATCQCMGSFHEDYSGSFTAGDEFEIAANTNQLIKCDTYLPYWWMVVSYAVAPTTGSLSAHMAGVE